MQNAAQIQPSYQWILGIDVSKETVDACLIRQADGQLFESKFHNNLSGFRHLKAWCKQMQCECDQHTLCCMEHTGLYTRLLVHYLVSREVKVKEFWSSFIEGKSKSGEFLRKAKGGDSAWLLANYTPVINSEGKVVKVIKLARDITKEKQFHSAASKKIERLEKEISDWKMKWDELSETFSKNT